MHEQAEAMEAERLELAGLIPCPWCGEDMSKDAAACSLACRHELGARDGSGYPDKA